MPHAIPQGMAFVKGTGDKPPVPPYTVFHSKKLNSVRIKMLDGKIYQWPIIERPKNLASIRHLDIVMQMPIVILRIIQKTIRDETKQQIGNPFYTVRWKFIHQRVKKYVIAKAQVKYPILMRFRDGWVILELMRRIVWGARTRYTKTKRVQEAEASMGATDTLNTPETPKRRCVS
ncbi:unnamed protein product [Rhizoctonia solani]|uniref:Uncharacterized protein n=1 Tax=Rhizoctonia solani TaxID=456999 RepID=A0A8H3DHM3_9AGAM|nr:unnamed protein product [Rhizoctonia solani]CAE6531330.1 unnamed protein product [Rhizoctonia solani]